MRQLRKELSYQWRHNRRNVSTALLVLVALSAASALMLWRDRWRLIKNQHAQQIHTQQGLLELRINQHRTTALDWGHWDTMYSFAGGGDPGFVARELRPSSIVADRQLMLIVDRRGRTLAMEPTSSLSPGLHRCLEQRLARLRPLTARASMNAAFGLYCRDDQRVLIGAGTGIRPSQGGQPERGWVIHLSSLERPSYNASLNRTFREIDRVTNLRSGAEEPMARTLISISGLLEPGERFVMEPSLNTVETARRAATLMLPAWLALNLVALGLVPVGLLLARQRRLPGRLRQLQEQRADRNRRHRISQVLLHRRHLLMQLEANPQAFSGCWIVALHAAAADREGSLPPKTLQTLALQLDQRIGPRAMALMDRRTLVMVFSPQQGVAAQTELEEALGPAGPEGDRQRWSGCLAPLRPGGETGQLLNLSAAAAAGPAPGDRLRLIDPCTAGAITPAPATPGQRPTERWIRQLTAGNYTIEPVVRLAGDQAEPLYHVLLCRPWLDQPTGDHEQPDSGMRAPGVLHAPAFELALLGEALARLQQPGTIEHALGIPLAAASLEDGAPALMVRLAAAPLELRNRLVLDLEESQLMAESAGLQGTVQELHRLGVQIAIDGFGTSHVPIQALFDLKPTYLKLGPTYTQRLQDENVDALVDFLLSYCRYKRCGLVLQGVESRMQRQYWQQRGVRLFQGSALTPTGEHAAPEPEGAPLPRWS